MHFLCMESVMCLWFNSKYFYNERQLLCVLGDGEGL